MAYTKRPFNPLSPYVNQVVVELNQVNDNFDTLAKAFQNDDPTTFIVKRALQSDTVDGFHASQTPAPNTLLPLNANARIYDYMPKGSIVFDPPDFHIAPDTEYLIGRVDITTPSWSPSGAWKLIFTVQSYFHANNSGNFIQRIKPSGVDGATWGWNAPSMRRFGVNDCLLIPDLPNGTTQQFNFYVVQSGASYGEVEFNSMVVKWYLFPA